MSETPHSQTVLVVEDDPLCMKLIVRLLALNGLKAVACPGGAEAFKTLDDLLPDLILLDIGMPGMDGFEVHRRIRAEERFSKIAVIALSASVMKEDEEKIRTEGFDDFIPKPVEMKLFADKIRKHLRPVSL
jgi:two-component system cell cycle response regulator DivK